jgi:hypothetical protein
LNTGQLLKSDQRNLVAQVKTMSKKNSENGLMPMVYKGACLVLVGLLTLLGIVGLIRNIVPVSRGIAAGKGI